MDAQSRDTAAIRDKYTVNVVSNYVSALKYGKYWVLKSLCLHVVSRILHSTGDKHFYETLPRMLTLWFNYGSHLPTASPTSPTARLV